MDWFLYDNCSYHERGNGPTVNPFVPDASFLYPLKTSKGFVVFSGDRKRVHWERMG